MLMIYWPLVIARWIHFASLFLLFGCSFFWLYVGRERSSAGRAEPPGALRATILLVRIAAPIAAISGIAWLACMLINMTRYAGSIMDPEDLGLFFFETPFGPVSFVRLSLLAGAVVIAFLPWHGRWRFAALALLSAALLITQAWFGHAAEGAGLYRAIVITVYAIHALATAAWVGGLPPLLFVLIEQRRFAPCGARERTLDVCSRFSLMGMIAVTLVAASGIANAGFRVAGSFGKLLDSDYGDMLFKKLVLVAAMLAVAYFNRFIAMPRLRASSLKDIRSITWLRYSVGFDIVLGALVLGASAVLGITMPPM